MKCIGDRPARFRVVAGPDACVDRRELVAEFREEALGAGIEKVWMQERGGTRFAFELDADSPESACTFVTGLLRSVYGLHWWADVTAAPEPMSTPRAQATAWN